jgi:hypothetical protein
MRVRQAMMAGVMAGLLVACSSSSTPSARAKFEAALEKTLLATAKSDDARAAAECVIRTTKNLSDADYKQIVEKENTTPEALEAYKASLAACGAVPTTPTTPAP